ncbi:MAG: adenosylmethionine--8-amino-7-oxononanoate transaminase [Candidatus Margulisbacteria bacterium]|nr:adenosylmethionine--8-amino-7-oxononanoate transaminase [Candidatus Margulisiibacteriota bacterium]
MLNPNSLLQLDFTNIWHPFTQMKEWMNSEQIIIERGQGNYLIDVKGRKYLDGVSSLWVNIHGHNHPYINKAICKQLKKIAHSTFLGLTNVPAIQLTGLLMEIIPRNLTRVFYSDNGSTSVEIALKIAYQYWQQHPETRERKRRKFISFTNAYHGDTIGSVSVGGIDLFHGIYEPLLFDTIKIQYPYPLQQNLTQKQSEESSLKQLEKCLETESQTIAGLIIEPLMQGASGMLNTSAQFLQKVRQLTKKHGVLMIVDEVATGFGRTGSMFAVEKADIEPDILCVAKGITGGYLPLAATFTTENIFSHFLGEFNEYKTFYHGHSYTGNSLACAAAIANLELFKKEKVLEKLQEKIYYLIQGLKEIEKLPQVAEVRQEGFMVGIELCKDRSKKICYKPEQRAGFKVTQAAVKKGVFLRPLGDVVVLMPPLSISRKQLNLLLDVTKQCIIEVTRDL